MVRHDFAFPLGHILTAKHWQCVEDGGLHFTIADTGWAKAAWGKIYGQWICGAAVFVYDYDKFVPTQMLGLIASHGVTAFCAPPTIYRFFIKEDLSKYDFSSLRHCSIAGEPLNPEVYHRFLEATAMKLREVYGQTEMAVAVAVRPWIEPKPGEKGQIVVRTDKRAPVGMFHGCYRDPELTAGAWHDGIHRTDDVIKSSDYRIGPFEVESALIEHPAVLECAVTGVPDPDRGADVKATVVLAKGYAPGPDLATELPKTISGKIRRVEIREKDAE